MSYGAGASGGAPQAAAIAQAVKAMGAIVKVEEAVFHQILARSDHPFVLAAPPAGFFQKNYRYATSHQGFIFYTESRQPVLFGRMLDLIEAKYIGVPTM